MEAPLKSPQKRTSPVSKRYQHQDRVSANRLRLWAIVRLFRLSPTEVARATGFSRPYVARLLSPRDEFEASAQFYRMVESKLGEIINGRSSQFFTVPAVSVERARRVLEQLQVEQTAAVEEMAKAA